jgi:hypothetical protein
VPHRHISSEVVNELEESRATQYLLYVCVFGAALSVEGASSNAMNENDSPGNSLSKTTVVHVSTIFLDIALVLL